MDREKDPTKEVLRYVKENSYLAQTSVQTKKSVGRFVEQELDRQKAEGLISEDADKINIAAAGYRKHKAWQRLFTMFAGGLILLLLVLAAVICVYITKGWELPQFLNF